MKKQQLIVILGPTASGKSGLAVSLAQHLHGEVISADSRQIYRGLDIGTEKISTADMQGIPHHCIDIASPCRSFSVEQWRQHAQSAISQCTTHGTVPILAGGTGLYIDALVYNMEFPKVEPNATLRRSLGKLDAPALFSRLQTLDPERAKTIEHENPRRLIRAIEIATALGKVPAMSQHKSQYNVSWIGVNPPFSELEQRIAARLDQALENGLVAETNKLREELDLSWRRIDELGMEYRVCAAFLQGELPKDELRTTLIREVRRYAKRQLTWLKRYKEVVWYENAEEALTQARNTSIVPAVLP